MWRSYCEDYEEICFIGSGNREMGMRDGVGVLVKGEGRTKCAFAEKRGFRIPMPAVRRNTGDALGRDLS